MDGGCVVLQGESSLNWLLSLLWIRFGLNTFTLKGLPVPSEGNLLQDTAALIHNNNNNNSLSGCGLPGGEQPRRAPHLLEAA